MASEVSLFSLVLSFNVCLCVSLVIPLQFTLLGLDHCISVGFYRWSLALIYMFIIPHQMEMSNTCNLDLKYSNLSFERGFEFPCKSVSFSQTINQSPYVFWLWKTGWDVRHVMPMLSWHMVGIWDNLNPSSGNRYFIKITSNVALAKARYSVLEFKTLFSKENRIPKWMPKTLNILCCPSLLTASVPIIFKGRNS